MATALDFRNGMAKRRVARWVGPMLHRGRAKETDPVVTAVSAVKSGRQALDREIVKTIRLLADRREWTAVIRLLVLAGSYQQVDIAKATGVMRSTVTRWFNGETEPQAEQIEIYLAGLIRLLEQERDLNVFVNADDLIVE